MRMPLRRPNRRQGAVTPFVAFIMVGLVAMIAIAIDLGFIALARTELQATADASAMAAATMMKYDEAATKQTDSIKAAKDCAAANTAGGDTVALADKDIEYGNWDEKKRVFQKDVKPINAVRVRAYRDPSNAKGALALFFAPVLGTDSANVYAEAIALKPGGGIGTRFLIDDEMFDSDVPAIENFAKQVKVSPDDLLRDNDGDWFIDLHNYVTPGQTIQLELPTGQVGDEGLFDIEANVGTSRPQFPFKQGTTPSLKDFLNYNEDSSSWRYDLIPTDDLDPLHGVGAWNNHNRYTKEILANPNFIHVSPLFDSDVSNLNDNGIDAPALEGVNALGERRGLVAFKIIDIGKDIDGPSGSELPHLIIQIVHPSLVSLEAAVYGASTTGGGRARLVR